MRLLTERLQPHPRPLSRHDSAHVERVGLVLHAGFGANQGLADLPTFTVYGEARSKLRGRPYERLNADRMMHSDRYGRVATRHDQPTCSISDA